MINTCALFNRDSFFRLPEASCFDLFLAILVSRYQPMGFFDDNGRAWCAVLDDDDKVRRQRIT